MPVQEQQRRPHPTMPNPQHGAADIDAVEREAREHVLRHQNIIPS
jgi:hypothetical protein